MCQIGINGEVPFIPSLLLQQGQTSMSYDPSAFGEQIPIQDSWWCKSNHRYPLHFTGLLSVTSIDKIFHPLFGLWSVSCSNPMLNNTPTPIVCKWYSNLKLPKYQHTDFCWTRFMITWRVQSKHYHKYKKLQALTHNMQQIHELTISTIADIRISNDWHSKSKVVTYLHN